MPNVTKWSVGSNLTTDDLSAVPTLASTRRQWGQQKPPAGSQIDWGHPLAQGLVFCALLNEGGGLPRELVTGIPAAAVLTMPTYSARGYETTGSNGVSWTVGNRLSQGNISLLWAGIFDSVADYQALLTKSSGAANPVDWYTQTSKMLCSDGTHNAVGTTTLVTGRRYQLGGKVGANGAAVYLNGVLDGTGLATAGVVDSANPWRIGRRGDGVTALIGATFYAYAWARSVSTAEYARLNAEPFAFIVPPGPSRRYFTMNEQPRANAPVHARMR